MKTKKREAAFSMRLPKPTVKKFRALAKHRGQTLAECLADLMAIYSVPK